MSGKFTSFIFRRGDCDIYKMQFLQLIGSVFMGVFVMFLVYLIPTERIENNVRISAEQMAKEECNQIVFSWCSSQLDNWTDSIMLLTAA